MKTNDKIIQLFIDYLEFNLVGRERNGFVKISPRCFQCISPVDKIFVYIRDDSILIVNDGDNVCDGFEIKRLHLNHLRLEDEYNEDVFNSYLQDILALF